MVDEMFEYIDPDEYSRHMVTLIDGIENGGVSIPRFQRQLVWTVEKSADLLDSILKNYPAGALTLWYSEVELRAVRDVGKGVKIHQKRQPEGDNNYNYVIDGQQRLLTLCACLNGAFDVEEKNVETDSDEEKKKHDFRDIYVDLSANPRSESVVITGSEKKKRDEGRVFISIRDLYQTSTTRSKKDLIARSYHTANTEEIDDMIDIFDFYQERLKGYIFPITQITNKAGIHVVTEMFTRINTTGKKLDLFEIMVAKTYDETKNFDLFVKYKEFQKELAGVRYGELPREVVLRVAAALIKGEYSEKDILQIGKSEFIEKWDDVCGAIMESVKFFKAHYGIQASLLLPYSKQVTTLFSYFFGTAKKKEIEVSGKQEEYLEEFFWRCALSDRYSHSSGGRTKRDMGYMMNKILGIDNQGKSVSPTRPDYDEDGWGVDFRPSSVMGKKGFFSPKNNDYIKAILSIYISKKPLNFDDGSDVMVLDEFLKQANSRNYHHFFPKGYLKGKDIECDANNVLNITLITQEKNQGYGKKPPSDYIVECAKNLKKSLTIEGVMATHLIGKGESDVLSAWGIKDDNYDLFIEKRAELLVKEIREKIDFIKDVDIDIS